MASLYDRRNEMRNKNKCTHWKVKSWRPRVLSFAEDRGKFMILFSNVQTDKTKRSMKRSVEILRPLT